MRTQLFSACVLLLAGCSWTLALAGEQRSYLVREPGAPSPFGRLNAYIMAHAPSDSLEDNFRTIRELVASKEFADEKDKAFRQLAQILSKFELNPEDKCTMENFQAVKSLTDNWDDFEPQIFGEYLSRRRLVKLMVQYTRKLVDCYFKIANAFAEAIKLEDLEERHGDMKVFDIINGKDFPEILAAAYSRSTDGYANLKDEEIYKIAHHVAQAEYGQRGLKFNDETGMDEILTEEEAEDLLKLAIYQRCDSLDDIEPHMLLVKELYQLGSFPREPRTDNERIMLLYASRYFTCVTVRELRIKDAAKGLIKYQLKLQRSSRPEHRAPSFGTIRIPQPLHQRKTAENLLDKSFIELSDS